MNGFHPNKKTKDSTNENKRKGLKPELVFDFSILN